MYASLVRRFSFAKREKNQNGDHLFDVSFILFEVMSAPSYIPPDDPHLI